MARVEARFHTTEANNVAFFLTGAQPSEVAQALRGGRDDVLQQFQLSPAQQSALGHWVDESSSAVLALTRTWLEAHRAFKRAPVEGFVAGLDSDETKVGALIGSIFGPIGIGVGAILGGLVAGAGVDERNAQLARVFAEAFDQWSDRCLHRFNDIVSTALNASLPPQPANDKLATAVGATVILLGVAAIAAAGYFGVTWLTSKPDVAQAASLPERPAPAVAPSLAGTWRASDGMLFDATSTGEGRFRIVQRPEPAVSADAARTREFALSRASDSLGSFQVVQAERPEAPKRYHYAPAAQMTCTRSFDTAAGEQLMATLDHGRLRIEAAMFTAPRGVFKHRGHRIDECVGLDAVPVVRTQLVLARP